MPIPPVHGTVLTLRTILNLRTRLATASRRNLGRPCGFISQNETAEGLKLMPALLKWALVMLVVSLVAALFGFTGISAASADVARILFFVFVVLFVVLLVLGLLGGRTVRGP